MGLMEYSDYVYVVPSELGGFGYMVDPGSSHSYVFVGRDGKRYRDETSSIVHRHPNLPEMDYDDKLYQYRHRPMFMVFDQALFDALNPLWDMPSSYPKIRLAKNPGEALAVDWSSNESAVERGWLFMGETLEELAANVRGNEACVSSECGIYEVDGIDAEGLKKTIEDFNAYCEAGEDEEFGRPIDEMAPFGSGPYYAIEITNGVMNTNGGPMRNEYAQTLNAYGEIIPRLYNTGEFGSFNGMLYNFGNLMEAATTGRVAAEHAAGLEAWESEDLLSKELDGVYGARR